MNDENSSILRKTILTHMKCQGLHFNKEHLKSWVAVHRLSEFERNVSLLKIECLWLIFKMFFALIFLGVSLQTRRPAVSTRFTKPIKLPSNYNNGFGCDMCTKVVQYIEQLIVDQTVESEIVTLVEQLCNNFPSPYSTLCDTVVEQYLPVIMQWIEQGIEALDICTNIGLCTATKAKKVARFPGKIALPKNYKNGFGCDMCTKIIGYVESLLKDQTVESEIASLVDQLCTTFSSPYSELCKTVIDTYLPLILQWLEEGLEALDICTKIGLCTTTKQSLRIPVKEDNTACETCEKWFQWSQQKLSEITVEGLWKFISEDCPDIPYLQYFCAIINEQNIETIVALINAQIPPEKACQIIKLC